MLTLGLLQYLAPVLQFLLGTLLAPREPLGLAPLLGSGLVGPPSLMSPTTSSHTPVACAPVPELV